MSRFDVFAAVYWAVTVRLVDYKVGGALHNGLPKVVGFLLFFARFAFIAADASAREVLLVVHPHANAGASVDARV